MKTLKAFLIFVGIAGGALAVCAAATFGLMAWAFYSSDTEWGVWLYVSPFVIAVTIIGTWVVRKEMK